jgi:hypothetical protein
LVATSGDTSDVDRYKRSIYIKTTIQIIKTHFNRRRIQKVMTHTHERLLTSGLVVLADPDVVRCAEIGDIRDRALAVDLPNSLELVLQVRAALWPEIDSVHVKDGPEQ